jgi:protein SCO1
MKIRTQLYLLLAGLIPALTCLAEEQHPTNTPPCCSIKSSSHSPKTNTPPLSDTSLYQLESVWTNDAGKALQLGTLQGRPEVVALIFTRCTYACPLLVHDMQQIEKTLPAELRPKIGFTLITMDPDRDTPEVLKAYRATHHLEVNWTVLRGSHDDVLEIAALLGVKFKKDEQGQFVHSNLITVLNERGEIISQQVGLNQKPDGIVDTLQHLLAASAK